MRLDICGAKTSVIIIIIFSCGSIIGFIIGLALKLPDNKVELRYMCKSDFPMTVVKNACKQHEVTCKQTLAQESSLLHTNTCFTSSTVLYLVWFGVAELCVATVAWLGRRLRCWKTKRRWGGWGLRQCEVQLWCGERLPASHMKERHTHRSSRPTRPAIYLHRRGRTTSCCERQQWAQVMTGGAMG